ncbi:MAG: hypothetical protein ACXVYM_08325 [Gaiellaceae bacterium]
MAALKSRGRLLVALLVVLIGVSGLGLLIFREGRPARLGSMTELRAVSSLGTVTACERKAGIPLDSFGSRGVGFSSFSIGTDGNPRKPHVSIGLDSAVTRSQHQRLVACLRARGIALDSLQTSA